MSDTTVQFDTRGLDKLLKAFSGELPKVKIGIVGAKNARSGGNSNATIGAKHEFGLDGMPIRSWLRMPLIDNMEKYLEKSGAFSEDVLKQVVKTGSIKPWMEKVGIVAEAIIADGFDTGGFGKWKPSNFAGKKNHQTLVETQQLRNSVTSEVK